jgi:hypothetical protein
MGQSEPVWDAGKEVTSEKVLPKACANTEKMKKLAGENSKDGLKTSLQIQRRKSNLPQRPSWSSVVTLKRLQRTSTGPLKRGNPRDRHESCMNFG